MYERITSIHSWLCSWVCHQFTCVCGGTGIIASSSTFRPHMGRVIRDLFRLLDAVYGIVRKH